MKITPDIKRKIRRIAETLPEDYYFASKSVLGADLLKEEIYKPLVKRFKEQKKEIDTKRYYHVSNAAKFKINHQKRLFRAYEASGLDGIKEYVSKY